MTTRTNSLLAIAACGLLAVSLTAGGQDARRGESDTRLPASVAVARKPRATVIDGYRAMARLARQHGRIDGRLDVDRMRFAELRTTLVGEGVIDDGWGFTPMAGLERDVLAYMAASYLDIRPGLLTSIFGMTRRYSYREMQHRGMMVQGQPRQIVSGSELLSVLTRVASEVDRRGMGRQ